MMWIDGFCLHLLIDLLRQQEELRRLEEMKTEKMRRRQEYDFRCVLDKCSFIKKFYVIYRILMENKLFFALSNIIKTKYLLTW